MDGVVLAVLFAWVPLAFYPRLADVFLLDKTTLVLAGLLFLVSGFGRESWGRVASSFVFRVAALFLGWMLVSSLVTAQAPGEILPGSTHDLILVGALAAGLAAGASQRRKARFFLKAGSWVVALLAVAQALGIDFGIDWTAKFDGRVFSTFGNPNYLAGYLAVLIPIVLVDFFRADRGRARWMAALHLAVLATVFTLAAVRGAFLGLGAALVLMALYAVARSSVRAGWGRHRVFWGVGVLFCLLSISGVMARLGGVDAFSFSGETAQQRLETWRVTDLMVKDHPWMGVGLGNFKVQYPAYQWRTQKVDPSEGVTAPYTVTDHVHNEFLQVAAEGGLVGLVLFLAWWGGAVWRLFRRESEVGGWDWEAAAALGVCGSVLGFSVTNFPLQLAPVALIAGWALASAEGPRLVIPIRPEMGRVGWVPLASLGVFLVMMGPVLAGSVANRDSVGEGRLGNMERAVRYAERLMDLSSGRYRACFECGQEFSLAGSGYVVKCQEAYDAALRCDPVDPEVISGKASVLYRVGKYEEALALAEKGIALAPNLHALQFVKGSALFQIKRYAEAEAAFLQASRLLSTHYDTWLNLGVVQVLQGKKSEAAQSWANALVIRPRDAQVMEYLESLDKK